MIRHRLIEMVSAVARAVELLRSASPGEAVAQSVLELLGQAARSERATYWTVDPELLGLRAIASWSPAASGMTACGGDTRHRSAFLSHANAGHVWRNRKPLWSSSIVLDNTLPPSLERGLGGGVWFAVKSDTAVYGVIELLGRTLEPNAPENLFVLERLGVRLGHAFEELCHGKSRGRFQWSPSGNA